MSNIQENKRPGKSRRDHDANETKPQAKPQAEPVPTVVDAALDNLNKGWKPIPIEAGEKGPRKEGWPNLKITRSNVREHFQPGMNIGVQLGKCSGGLTDTDLDCREAMILADDFLPKTGSVFGRKSKPRAHFLYVTDLCDSEQKAAIQFKDPVAGSMLVEMRIGGNGKGAQTMAPPSKHSSGERVRWNSDGEAAKVDGENLKTDVSELAAAALLVKYYPGEGSRHHGGLALGGILARAKWNAGDICRFVTAVARGAGDEEWRERANSAQDAIEALDKGSHVYGFPKMCEIWGQQVVEVVAKWLGVSTLTGRVMLQADDPVTCGKEFLKHEFSLPCSDSDEYGNVLTLCFYRGSYYRWTGTHYAEADPKEVRSKLYAFLDNAVTMRGQTIGPFKPTKTKVNSILDTLESGVLQARDNEVPFWIGPHEHGSAEGLIACRNGLLDVSTREFIPHTPFLFNVNCLPFDYDPDAPAYPKRWLKFLRELWPGDDDGKTARFALQEIFGLMLAGDTRHHKIFLIIGPPRAGKGTIAYILKAMLGADSVVNPTLGSLSGEFGLQPLIDKRAAIVSDARIGSHTSTVVERLLSISGEDPLSINRKNQVFWNGKLGVRFLILTNEMPGFADASGALVSRFVVLILKESFLGKEDLGLKEKLLPDLPSILNWSLCGLDRLRKYGAFEMPKSSHDKIRQLLDLASPVNKFTREWCEVGEKRRIEVKKLFDAYTRWCGVEVIKAGSASVFGKNLHASVPLLRARRVGNERFYQGIGLSKYGSGQYELETEKKKKKNGFGPLALGRR
jgi:putative DNA primase/helicase